MKEAPMELLTGVLAVIGVIAIVTAIVLTNNKTKDYLPDDAVCEQIDNNTWRCTR